MYTFLNSGMGVIHAAAEVTTMELIKSQRRTFGFFFAGMFWNFL